MASEPTIAVLGLAPIEKRQRAIRFLAAIPDYWALTKPEVSPDRRPHFSSALARECIEGGD